jgi:RNA polymerase sigma-70 factor, ECF subfamily
VDQQLVLRARAGDQEAYELIVVERGEQLYRTALAILGREADARDATQQALIAGWLRLSDLRDTDRFDAWLGRILVNECRMSLRRRGRLREVPMPQDGDMEPTAHGTRRPTDQLTSDPHDGSFDQAFEQLSADQRTILVLHHLHGYGIAEIAAWLGIPSGTVKWRLSRARHALRDRIEAR